MEKQTTPEGDDNTRRLTRRRVLNTKKGPAETDSDYEKGRGGGGGGGGGSGSGGGGGGGGRGGSEERDNDSSGDEDPKGMEGAAYHSRVPFHKMTDEESDGFSDITSASSKKLFLHIRNRVLQMWMENPKQEVLADEAIKIIEPPFNSDPFLVRRVHSYLDRHGYINFGVFKQLSPPLPKNKGKIIVVGAGIAGLIAAQQLDRFGFEVQVVEPRSRVGGRIASFRKGHYVGDLGAMVITGLNANPISVLAKQLALQMTKVKQKCPLFEASGETITKEKDEMIEREFNRLLEATSYVSQILNLNEIDGKKVSLGETLEWIIHFQERQVKKKQLEYWKEVEELHRQIVTNQEALAEMGEKANIMRQQLDASFKLKEEERLSLGSIDITRDFEYRSRARDLNEAGREFEQLVMQQKGLEDRLNGLEAPSDVYLSTKDRHILDWHFANLEFATATPLNLLSLKHWDQDEDFEGSHMAVSNGYSVVPMAISDVIKDKIHLSTAVRGIRVNDRNVQVITYDPSKTEDNKGLAPGLKGSAPEAVIKADAVLCTLPLGVLKQTISTMGTLEPNHVQFQPPLPEWKVKAIQNLGFGNLNKIIMCWDRPFWDNDVNLFGNIGTTKGSRGENFLFWNVYKAPVLMALMAGESADVSETVTEDVIVSKALVVLKAIFTSHQVPYPKESVVTRWRSDPWAKGAYSFIGVNATGEDLKLLGEPVSYPLRGEAPSKEGEDPKEMAPPRLFFAGEHTIQSYPATVHGALLSGLREAGRIANRFTGVPYAPPLSNSN